MATLPADVLAFQEVWFPQAREILLAAGRRVGLRHAWSPDGRLFSSGLLVMSRLPIEEASLTHFALSGRPERVTQGEYYGGKGYVRARLATPAGPVSVVDTHLHAGGAGDVKSAGLPYRVGQEVQLALAMRAFDEPLITAGDFNFTDAGREHAVWTGLSGLRDLAQEAGHPQATALRSNPFRRQSRRPDHRIDYVFGRDGRRTRVRVHSVRRVFDEPLDGGRLAYSNHAGVLAEVSIEPTPDIFRWHPTPQAVATARGVLARGRSAAERRRAGERTVTGAGLGLAALVAAGDRRLTATTRRRFLSAGLKVVAAGALAPSVGCSLLSEVFVRDEIRSYDRLSRALERVQHGLARNGATAGSLG